MRRKVHPGVQKALLKQRIKRTIPIPKWKILSGDIVQILKGPSMGNQGKVKRVDRKLNLVYVEGQNLKRQESEESEKARSMAYFSEEGIHYSKVALVDPSTNKPTKIRWGKERDSKGILKKVRVSKKTSAIIPNPGDLYVRKTYTEDGPKDTPPDVAFIKSFDEMTLVPSIEYIQNLLKRLPTETPKEKLERIFKARRTKAKQVIHPVRDFFKDNWHLKGAYDKDPISLPFVRIAEAAATTKAELDATSKEKEKDIIEQ
eukprot:TRINITY_DN15143_c0_g1_i1.p1 TRINITY_DN15143_c0_g1~~TRINITY_DN15143_c0_g1_i1.p1  ORF type:complete len:259 (-),score=68.32 TRINITY_DN15143_c0_g1_i1:23-799(-)